MKTISKVLTTAGLAAVLAVGGGAAAANAGYSYLTVGGGWWTYGTGIYTYSDFTHNQRYHTSSVIVDGNINRSPKTAPGRKSQSTLKTGRANYAYWNNI